MLTDVVGDTRERIVQVFPDRQIYLRSSGEVTYFSLSTKLQLTLASALGVLILWSLFSLVSIVLGPNLFQSQNDKLQQVESRYERLLADSQAKQLNAQTRLAEQRETFRLMTANLEAKHNTMSQIMGTGTLDLPADTATLQYADAAVIMAPTTRDLEDRVARHAGLDTPDMDTGLSFDTTLMAMDESQNAMLLSAEFDLLEKIDFNRAIIRATGLDLDTVLSERTGGQGGPFIPLDGLGDLPNGKDFQPRMTAIQARLSEAEVLDDIVTSLPLAHPVEDITGMSSHFGVRSDPFTKRPTFHQGLDFRGRAGAPIVATAAGTVRYAGRKGSFGRMVEIDHGNGFITRYAHLKQTTVKRGQTVEAGDMIGGMGTTGRSTGVHLHYEIHFQGRVYDPQEFLKAGLYVQ